MTANTAAANPTGSATHLLTPALTLTITAAAGMSIANVYYNQPILGLLMKNWNVTASQVASVPFLAQIGYALGIMFISPLGDRFERKSLILLTMSLLALVLGLTALAPDLVWLAIGSLLIGLAATVTQQLVPMAVMMAPPAERGKVIGTVTGGILLGVLLARTVSGFVSERWSWQVMYGLAALLVVGAALVLAVKLPKMQASTRISYPQLLASVFALIRQHPVLRRAALIQGLIFSVFMAFWCNLAVFLAQSPSHLGSTAIGMFGVVGVVGVFGAPLAGRLADKRGPVVMVRIGTLMVLAGYVIFWLGQSNIAALVAGIVLLDLGIQASQVANQTRVYALDPAARSRLNTVFMTAMFGGGAIGTAASGYLYSLFGWHGVCGFAVLALLAALGLGIKK